MKILLTGAAGFIGHFTALALIKAGHEVIGLDSVNDYYEIALKEGRLAQQGIELKNCHEGEVQFSSLFKNYRFYRDKLENHDFLEKLFANEKFTHVCHLAAQAGVRYSISNPRSYISSNILGTLNILEASRKNSIENLVYASSSSVYGLNKKQPFLESDGANHPVSLYAASKKSTEMMAHSYSHIYGLPVTGLRFFTVYGPWGRPDMAPMLFARAIMENKEINVFNNGEMSRDFTYVEDIVEGIILALFSIAEPSKYWDALSPDPSISEAPFRIYNIGNSKPVKLMDFIHCIEKSLGRKALLNMQPMQAGDVVSTWADTSSIQKLNYKSKTNLEEGVSQFIDWFLDYEGRTSS